MVDLILLGELGYKYYTSISPIADLALCLCLLAKQK